MNHQNLNLYVPGINSNEIDVIKENLPSNGILHFITLAYVIVWRSQIAQSQSQRGLDKKEVQAAPSMKFTARLFNTSPVIMQIFGVVSVTKASAELLRFTNYKDLNREERKILLLDEVEVTTNSPHLPAKILSTRQINNKEDLITHRKGYIAQLKGTMQATCVFQPGSVIRGTNVSNINPSDISTLIASLLKLPIDSVQNCLKSWYRETLIQDSSEENTQEPDDSLGEILTQYIKHSLDIHDDELIFQDGFIASANENNTLPMEIGLNIIRNRPAELQTGDINIDPGDDPLLKVAAEQWKTLSKQYRNVKASPSKPKARAKSKARPRSKE
jgi:hypothetical protein